MISFIWKYRFSLIFLLFIFFCLSLSVLKNPKIYFDTERILEMSSEEKDVIDESIDDKNLLLASIRLKKEINYKSALIADSVHKNLLSKQSIRSVSSLFNEKKIIGSNFIPILSKRLKLNSEESFKKSFDRIKNQGSNFVSKDLKSLLFVINKNENADTNLTFFFDGLKSDLSKINDSEVYITGQSKSEHYMQDSVTKEIKFMTLFSSIFCAIVLWFFVRNIMFVIINLVCVIFSISITFSISQLLYGGIELVMILMPAIIFIVCISDFLHLTNFNKDDLKKTDKFQLFQNQVKKIGIPVFLTSITTAIGFLSFIFSDVMPLTRFGIITCIGIFISLFSILIFYSLVVDKKIYGINEKANKTINSFIEKVTNIKKIESIFLLSIFIFFSIFGILNLRIDNYITDEINKNSKLYEEIKFFDDNFGGIKPITFNISRDSSLSNEKIVELEKFLKKNEVVIDFSSASILSPSGVSSTIKSRIKDIGSRNTNLLIEKTSQYCEDLDLNISYSGVGFLFDNLSNKMTKEVLIGLVLAIILVGLLFVIINNYKIKFFIIALVPNIIPIISTIGIFSVFSFYFCLSNAFIFAIVFGLIVDDSIHIISSYRSCIKRNLSIDKSVNYVTQITSRAVIKTTIVIIFTLIPLLFSEFKSVSQLASISIVAAIVAVIFDLIFLPKMLRFFS